MEWGIMGFVVSQGAGAAVTCRMHWSPLLEESFVHGEAKNSKHGGTDARPQPKRRVFQVSLGHVSVKEQKWRKKVDVC